MENSDEMPLNVVCTVYYSKINLQRKKYIIFLKIKTYVPSIYIMDHPDFIVCSSMGNSIGLERVNHEYDREYIFR